MKRLYHKIYLTIVVALLLVVLVAGGDLALRQPPGRSPKASRSRANLLAAVLPPADAPAAAQQDAIRQFAQRLRTNLALFDKDLRLIASYGDRAAPAPASRRPGFMPGAGAWAIPLPDGRWIVGARAAARTPSRHRPDPAARRHRAGDRALRLSRWCAD